MTPLLDPPLTLQEQAEEFPAPGSSTLAFGSAGALTSLVAQIQTGCWTRKGMPQDSPQGQRAQQAGRSCRPSYQTDRVSSF